jgi:uncharacterized membrane protein YwzB
LALLITLISAGLLLGLPRRWIWLPLLIGATYVPLGQALQIGPLSFPAIRILIVVGCLRVVMNGERLAGRLNTLDTLMILWGIWLICSSIFHDGSVLTTRLGEVFTYLGVYFLFRVSLQEVSDLRHLFKGTCALLVPLAVLMLLEKLMAKNYCSLIFGGSGAAYLRGGNVRAVGPFGHAITAGTVGAVCLPMALYFWRQERKLALLGLAATGTVVLASYSSGPYMTALTVLCAMTLWRMRDYLRVIRWLALFLVLALQILMNDPVYFLIARIDLAGGSTSWYRARLIQSALEHWDEWWLAGTDFTRHWMHVGIGDKHADITNHYVQMGVWGGLPLMLLFMATLFAAFAAIGKALHLKQNGSVEQRFLFWTLGSILFGHATTFFSISYFDQSAIFFYLIIAVIAALDSVAPAPAAVTQSVLLAHSEYASEVSPRLGQ